MSKLIKGPSTEKEPEVPVASNRKLRNRKSRLSIASGLSTPFDVDDIELVGRTDSDDIDDLVASISDTEILKQNTKYNRKDSDNDDYSDSNITEDTIEDDDNDRNDNGSQVDIGTPFFSYNCSKQI